MKTVLFWVVVVAALVASEVIENTRCRNANILSETNEISFDPCPDAEDGEPCTVVRGRNVTITIKFVPSITPSRPKSNLAWVSGVTDINLRDMKPDACLFMECPVKVNEENTFSSTLSLGSTLPNGIYTFKLKIQDVQSPKSVVVCQLFKIRLTNAEEE